MKKIFLLVLLILLLCGCNRTEKRINDNSWDELYVTYDNETCVEYIEYDGIKKGGLSVRYNRDGTIKINKQCLNEKED